MKTYIMANTITNNFVGLTLLTLVAEPYINLNIDYTLLVICCIGIFFALINLVTDVKKWYGLVRENASDEFGVKCDALTIMVCDLIILLLLIYRFIDLIIYK
jgi:accessory gene regulator protein AgrB